MEVRDKFRAAMRNYVYSVSVLSLKDSGGTPYAITVSSVVSVSLEPSSLLVCINKSARIHDSIKEGSDVCINLLTKDHEEISKICSSDSQFEKRFDDCNWNTENVPFLETAQANIFGKVDTLIAHYSHTILLVRVLDAKNKDGMNTLVYTDGKYE